MNLPHKDKQHEPLAFIEGHFKNAQLRWSNLEKESFIIIATFERMHWMASCPKGFDLCTDNSNLIFIVVPISVVPDPSQFSLRKVIRWAVRLSYYNYI